VTQSPAGFLELRRKIPAILTAVDDCIGELRALVRGLDRSDRFALELLAREALANAVRHGSGQNPALAVDFAFRLRKRAATIMVADSGSGFDWRRAPLDLATNEAEGGRGRAILLAYAARVRYNKKGNRVALTMKLNQRGAKCPTTR
jgi:anti-sigma regulatory factor (Ser/Thr protein kinase)